VSSALNADINIAMRNYSWEMRRL